MFNVNLRFVFHVVQMISAYDASMMNVVAVSPRNISCEAPLWRMRWCYINLYLNRWCVHSSDSSLIRILIFLGFRFGHGGFSHVTRSEAQQFYGSVFLRLSLYISISPSLCIPLSLSLYRHIYIYIYTDAEEWSRDRPSCFSFSQPRSQVAFSFAA